MDDRKESKSAWFCTPGGQGSYLFLMARPVSVSQRRLLYFGCSFNPAYEAANVAADHFTCLIFVKLRLFPPPHPFQSHLGPHGPFV